VAGWKAGKDLIKISDARKAALDRVREAREKAKQ
jgi:hypothetical protein